ncbi:hypothetical protein [Curtobacterium flaccumfaciens]|nr:hypothetical protein [Curtobacterium flaccumfaciens]MBO9049384.1 hypothetical protein [Curtobacterium flaccumfaciens pv. flaccumfaciens]
MTAQSVRARSPFVQRAETTTAAPPIPSAIQADTETTTDAPASTSAERP